MISSTFGDVARQRNLSQNMGRLKSEITALTQEMSSGQVRDPAQNVQGDIMRVASLDKTIAQASSRLQVFSLISTRLDAQHAAMTAAHDTLLQTADLLLRPEILATPDRLSPTARQVGQTFGVVVGMLNAQAGGRSLFAGVTTDRPALAPAEDMLTELASRIPAGADRSTVDQIVDDWFSAGGGFDSSGYLGGDGDIVALDLGDDASVRFAVTAADQDMRQILANLAKGALMDADMTRVSDQTRKEVLTAIGMEIRTDAAGLRLVIENIGVSQARTEQAATRQQAAQSAATMARNNLVAADPYEVATALQDSIAQMEQVFAVTARLSRLSLSAYL